MTPAKQNRRAIRREAIESAVDRSKAAGHTMSKRRLKAYFRTALDRHMKQTKEPYGNG